MRQRESIRLGVIPLTAILALQVAAGAQGSFQCSSAQPGNGSVSYACAIVREIDDPHTGEHWLLMRDPSHPGGPGVLVAKESIPQSNLPNGAIVQLNPVIRAGDRITVEQSNETVDLRMQGIALSPASAGAPLRVRLGINGKVVETVAVGPGRAALSPKTGFWR